MVVFKDTRTRTPPGRSCSTVSDPKTQVVWYETVTDLPAVQAAWDDPDVKADPNVKMFGEQLKDTKAQPVSATWSEIVVGDQRRPSRR